MHATFIRDYNKTKIIKMNKNSQSYSQIQSLAAFNYVGQPVGPIVGLHAVYPNPVMLIFVNFVLTSIVKLPILLLGYFYPSLQSLL